MPVAHARGRVDRRGGRSFIAFYSRRDERGAWRAIVGGWVGTFDVIRAYIVGSDA